jgi:hypothetical protein
MSLRSGTWIIAVGVLMMFLGLCFLPAAFGDSRSGDLLAAGSSLFSLGGMVAACGIYSKARVWKAQVKPEEANSSAPAQARRVRGGCDLCGTEAPVIQCTVHELHLCSNCLSNHYDVRSCAYVPSGRNQAGKAARSMAKGAGRA